MLSEKKIKDLYPLPAYNYRVQIGSESYGFSQVSGLSFKYDTITYRHGLSAKEGALHMLGLVQPINLTLQKGIVSKGSKLLEWVNEIYNYLKSKQDITLDLCDEKGKPLVSWYVYGALPTAYQAGEFQAKSNEVAIESLSLIANNMRVTYHDAPSGEQSGGAHGAGFM